MAAESISAFGLPHQADARRRANGQKTAADTQRCGWHIIKTLGYKIVKLHPINGFAAEASSAAVIAAATQLGIPVSTTHNISAAIMGVGAARRLNAIRWTIVESMVWAWLLTIPVTGLLAYLFVRLVKLV